MADDEFEDTFADELEMMRGLEQEEREGEKNQCNVWIAF